VTVNLSVVLDEAARRHPEGLAVRDRDRTFTYSELQDLATRAAGLLRERGVRSGDRVLLALPNTWEFVVAWFGAIRAGAVAVPVSPAAPARDLAHVLTDCQPAAAVVDVAAQRAILDASGQTDVAAAFLPAGTDATSGFAAALVAARPLDRATTAGDDAAVLLYTSGTTGRPKGATLTHTNMLSNAHQLAALYGWQTGRERTLGVPPMHHAIGQSTIMLPLFLVGGLLHLQSGRFDPHAVLDQVEHEQITTLVGVPTFYGALVAAQQTQPRDLSSLLVVVSGGAPLAPEVQMKVEATLGVDLLQVYGLSETSPIATGTPRHRPRSPGSVGRPLWGIEVRLVAPSGQDVPPGQIGEVLIRGHNVMAGYWNRPDATAAAIDPAGWFATGDLARADPSGDLYIVDRTKDMINRNGFKVYPREVEDVLLEHPDVLHVAVLGVPDPRVGEQVAALAVSKPGRTVTPYALETWLRERVAAPKRPGLVQVVDTLPTTASGKILKRAINREPLQTALAAVAAAAGGGQLTAPPPEAAEGARP